MLKIAVIGTRGIPATWGGIERQCEEVYTRMAAAGEKITVYTRRDYVREAGIEPPPDKYHGVELVYMPTLARKKGVEAFVHTFFSTLHACFSDADVLHFYAQGPCLFTWLPRLLAPRKKVVFTCQGLDWRRDKWVGWQKHLIHLGEWMSARLTHARIGVSREIVAYYADVYGVTMKRIPNGTASKYCRESRLIREKFGLEPGKYLIFVGRLVPEKAVHEVIQAFKALETDYKLVITGDTSASDDYVQKLKRLAGADPRILFTSYAFGELLDELFSNALAYVSASHLEGLPLTLLEAMAYGLPVLVSNIPPHQEVLEQALIGESIGWSYPVGQVNMLTWAMEHVIQADPAEVYLKGQRGRQLAEQVYGWDTITRQYRAFYQELFMA